MSTQTGTLQPKARTIQPMWPVAILALLVVAIVATIVFAPEGSRPREETTSVASTVNAPVSTGIPATHGKQLGIEVSLPQTFAGTLANTPTELTGGISFSTAGAVTTAPAELSGRFLAERAKQLGTEVGGVTPATTTGDDVCAICWKYR
jgi:hypothetical protein